ncbi:hypothetical protein [Chitinophaga tropicalis]|uniref:Uncharacterized protein n=1 Tax=Chitinophaga tropicalis TaxID=2683588 RepID=A0A7K1U794_9BACT|nr:hypothetical protein [Chitinophaga tropicalis]MVT10234.1 hypothetical protein [Chitinophaga tropicalis]
MASKTLFTYDLQPSNVFVGTTINMTLTITNPPDGNDVKFTGGPHGDEIDITFPPELVTSTSFQSESQTAAFVCGKVTNTNYFAIKAKTGAGSTLMPGDNIVVLFKGVPINGTVGSANVTAAEYIGSHEGSASMNVTKQPAQLAIIAWLQPPVVGQGQLSTLYWQSMGGIEVKIIGFQGNPAIRTFPVQGDPPYPGNCDVYVPDDKDQWIYTAQVLTGDGKHAEQEVTLTQHAPYITEYRSDPIITTPISVTDNVKLIWKALYAASTAVQKPNGTVRPVISELEVTPGQDLLEAYQGNYESMPDTASYILTAFGYRENPQETLSFRLKPVELAYFKYTQKDAGGKLSAPAFATVPFGWRAARMVQTTNLNTLTIFQPGGYSDVYYLGSADTTHPQIQYFNAEKGAGDEYTFSWVTANLNSLALNPGNYNITGADIGNGSKSLKLEAGTYTLNGTGTDGTPIQSLLTVPYTPAARELRTPQKIHNYFAPSTANKQDAKKVIKQLTYDDIWRLPPFRITEGSVSLVLENTVAGGGRMWGIHVNGIQHRNVIAGIHVHGSLRKGEKQKKVESLVKKALEEGLQNGSNILVDTSYSSQ